MAQSIIHQPQVLNTLIALLLSIVMLLPATTTPTTTTTGSGFQVELIHRDSPRSPFYQGNLTSFQRFQRLIALDEPRIAWLTSHFAGANLTTIRAPMRTRGLIYMVSITIGTLPGRQTYFLDLDTGSDITWVQCRPCKPCYVQSDPLFDPATSGTCTALPLNHRLCQTPRFRHYEGKCRYDMNYADKSTATGDLMIDTFTFQSSSGGGSEAIPNVIFGCTHEDQMRNLNHQVAGLFALGRSPVSLVTQLSDRTANKFSYCFPTPVDEATPSFLRFGDDIKMREPVQRTRFFFYTGRSHYYLNLVGIQLNDDTLPIPEGAFNRNPAGSGGVIIDTGSTISHLIRPAYDVVRRALVGYFRPFHLVEIQGPVYGVNLDLCYRMPGGFERNLPGMTLNFARSAALRIRWQELFLIQREENYFCWAMAAEDRITIIGGYQQYNTRFTYDLSRNELLFSPEDCSLDGRA